MHIRKSAVHFWDNGRPEKCVFEIKKGAAIDEVNREKELGIFKR